MYPHSDVTANGVHGALFKQVLTIKDLSRFGAVEMVAMVTPPKNKHKKVIIHLHKMVNFTLTRCVQMSVNSLLSQHRMFL